MSVQLTILGSGSAGNCAYLECGETRLLIDAGFSALQIRKRLAGIGRSPETLTGILVTHEHSDHVLGIPTLTARTRVPVYANRLTMEEVEGKCRGPIEKRLFQTGSSFELGEIRVESFTIPHDAADPVGFLIHTPVGKIAFATDMGHATGLVLQRLREAAVVVLETNYDHDMLRNDTRRPWSLKQRIVSRHGHLSNEAAGKLAGEAVTDHWKHVYLAHLSRDCNTPALAQAALKNALAGIDAGHVNLICTDQAIPCPTLEL